MTIPGKDEVQFFLRFETFDLRPYSKESSCNFKTFSEATPVPKLDIVCPTSTPCTTRFISSSGAPWKMSTQHPMIQSFLSIILSWIVFMKSGSASTTKTHPFFLSWTHPLATTSTTSLYRCSLCTPISRCSRSLLSLVMNMSMLTKMVSILWGPSGLIISVLALSYCDQGGSPLKGQLKYLLMPLLGKNQLAIAVQMFTSIGPNLDNTHRGQI